MGIRIIRKIDELGRIVIPKDIRTTLNLQNGDGIAIAVEGSTVVLRNVRGRRESCAR